MSLQRLLTGVKPTGIPHIGNYFGAIKPAIEQAKSFDSFLFIADYHALTTFKSAKELSEHILTVAAAWIALGLDPEKITIYKQSDIPEIFELAWILSCFTAKGLLNRAHAYKSSVDLNTQENRDADYNINAGLFNYPVLMAADILIFQANKVPVGADQKQHIEIARDIAEVLNNEDKNVFTVPEAIIGKDNQLIPGIDGRKMSKNYNNTIPIFSPEKQLRKRCMQIVTDSIPVEEPKKPESCFVFQLFKYFLNEQDQDSLKARYQNGGLGYGTVKQELFETIMTYFKDARLTFNNYMNHPEKINHILDNGQQKARPIAQHTLYQVKKVLGLS